MGVLCAFKFESITNYNHNISPYSLGQLHFVFNVNIRQHFPWHWLYVVTPHTHPPTASLFSPGPGRCPPRRRFLSVQSQHCSAPQRARELDPMRRTPEPWRGNWGRRQEILGHQSQAMWCNESGRSPLTLPSGTKNIWFQSWLIHRIDRVMHDQAYLSQGKPTLPYILDIAIVTTTQDNAS